MINAEIPLPVVVEELQVCQLGSRTKNISMELLESLHESLEL